MGMSSLSWCIARSFLTVSATDVFSDFLIQGSTRAFPPHHPLIPVDYQFTGQPVLIGGTMVRGRVASSALIS